MRVLFQMDFPAYLRMYGSTIRLLADRGHRVLLSYDSPDKRRDSVAEAIEALDTIEVVPPLPAAARRYEPAVEQLRAATDYLRYLDPRFGEAPYLRRRLDKYLRGRLGVLTRLPYGAAGARVALRAALAAERLVPSDDGVEDALRRCAPDAIVVTPFLGRSKGNRRQTDTVKAARRLRLPVAAGVASWDHLTTKGIFKAVPDRVFVWNEIQAREARELHFVPAERIIVTGAQLFDGWFERRPGCSRADFVARLGLPAGRYVLYVGSSPNIAPAEREIPFVRRWLEALRTGGRDLRDVGVLVRPHPYSVEAWSSVDFAALGATVAPRRRPEVPMTEADEELYFHSVHFASAVVGINTSAMVEAFVQRRPVLTIRTPEFRETQEGTLHFGDLVTAAGGALQIASTTKEHRGQLRAALENPERHRPAIDAFLRTFVRPHGLERPATPILADAIERLARFRR